MKRLLLYLIIVLTAVTGLEAKKNLDKLSDKMRNEYLIKTAKKAVMKYAPGYYKEFAPPKIERCVIDKNDANLTDRQRIEYMGQVYYMVEYPYDRYDEIFVGDFSAQILIWEKSGEVFAIMSGSGVGYLDLDQPEIRDQNFKPIPYEKTPTPRWMKEKMDREKGENNK